VKERNIEITNFTVEIVEALLSYELTAFAVLKRDEEKKMRGRMNEDDGLF
jgi:hypothetical protein